ncbi:DUF262 domain-containing protein [Candidatus Pacearchaeota archaeon]|nr:DUF262 domain-containing protein [Candidatus Pacearchaeota archaeon]
MPNQSEDILDLEDIPSENQDLDLDNASYKINTYGADFTVEILSGKLIDKEIVVPSFQRRYVWPHKKASKLIESFLLGLPVPQIFLYRKEKTQDLIVVDGQQRLRTINYYLRETFEDGSPFRLESVKQQWEGKLYSDLTEQDKRKFKNSVLRTTIFEQTDPKDESSVFEIFERLNTGGMALTLQEIRNCVVNGNINSFLEKINGHSSWRSLLGKSQPDSRMKDIEMILRFFALRSGWKTYKKPMKDFVSSFMKEKKDINEEEMKEFDSIFKFTTDSILSRLGSGAFRLKSGINVALLDALMVSLAGVDLSKISNIDEKYNKLISNESFKEAVSQHTTDVDRVQSRIKIANEIFSE